MTGRHRRSVPAPTPDPDALAEAVTAAVDAALDLIDHRTEFEAAVLGAFSEVVWRLHNDRWMVALRSEPERALPAVMTASSAALPAVVDTIAARLGTLASATRVQLGDPEPLAEILVRLAHAVLLVPDAGPGLTARTDAEAYARRHVTPVVRYAVSGRTPVFEEGVALPRALRRFRAELAVATLIAVMIGSAGWVTATSRQTPPSVTPTNLTGSVPEPPLGHDDNPPPRVSTSTAAALPPPAEPPPTSAAPSMPGWTPKPVGSPTSAPATADGAASKGSDGPPVGPAGALPPVPSPPGAAPPVAANPVGGPGQPVNAASSGSPPGSPGGGAPRPGHGKSQASGGPGGHH